MSQESVNEAQSRAPHAPQVIQVPQAQQEGQTVEGMLRQITNELLNIRQEIGGVHARMDHMEGIRSAPPNVEVPRARRDQPLPPPPPTRGLPYRQADLPPPIPPYRDNRGGGRGRGRSDPMTRLQEQERGAPSRIPHEEEYGEFDGLNESYDERHHARRNPRGRASRDEYYDDEEEYYDGGYERRRPPRPYQPRRRHLEEEDEFKDIKIHIPTFSGSRNPEVYLEWERKVDLAFEYREYSERKKLKLIIQEFSGYALTWWDDLHKKRERNREGPFESWEDLKREMKARFVPSNYHREIHQKLQ